MIMNDDQLTKPEETLAYTGFVWFHRIVAVYCLVFGVTYWVRLIGIYDGPLWRFDLMPLHWQLASASLAALFPVAAIGLWMMVSWGPVIWLAAAAGEVIMHFGFPQLYRLQAGYRRHTCGRAPSCLPPSPSRIRLQKRKKKV